MILFMDCITHHKNCIYLRAMISSQTFDGSCTLCEYLCTVLFPTLKYVGLRCHHPLVGWWLFQI